MKLFDLELTFNKVEPLIVIDIFMVFMDRMCCVECKKKERTDN